MTSRSGALWGCDSSLIIKVFYSDLGALLVVVLILWELLSKLDF